MDKKTARQFAREVHRYYQQTRGKGNTNAQLAGAKHAAVIYVCRDVTQARTIAQSVTRVLTIAQVNAGELRGHDLPLVVDHSIMDDVMYVLLSPPVRFSRLFDAAKKFVDRIDFVHADSDYADVWVCAQGLRGKYDGPTYEAELNDLKKALK